MRANNPTDSSDDSAVDSVDPVSIVEGKGTTKWTHGHRRMLKEEHRRAVREVASLQRALNEDYYSESDGAEANLPQYVPTNPAEVEELERASIDLIDAHWNLCKHDFRQKLLDEEGILLYNDRQPGLAPTERVLKLNAQQRQWVDEARLELQEEAAASVGRGGTATAGRRAGNRANALAGAGKTAAAGAGKAALASAELRRTSKHDEDRSRSRSRGRSTRRPTTRRSASPPILLQPRSRSPTRISEPARSNMSTGIDLEVARKVAEARALFKSKFPQTRRPPWLKPREPVSAKCTPKRTPALGGPPDLQGGKWVRVRSGWLTGCAHHVEELGFLGADVVASLRRGCGIALGIAEADESAGALTNSIVFPVYSIGRQDCSGEDCKQLARFALFAESNLDQGNRVVVHCRHGLHRTGLAIYLLLRLIMGEPEECLSMMEEMRPTMHKEFVHRQLHSKVEEILADSRFTSPWYLASRQARPRA
jgi:hypothetical protein